VFQEKRRCPREAACGAITLLERWYVNNNAVTLCDSSDALCNKRTKIAYQPNRHFPEIYILQNKLNIIFLVFFKEILIK